MTSTPRDRQVAISPGPQDYNLSSTITPRGNNFNSKYANSGAPIFSHSKRREL